MFFRRFNVNRTAFWLSGVCFLALVGSAFSLSQGQDEPPPFDLAAPFQADLLQKLEVSAQFFVERQTGRGRLQVTAVLDQGWYVYSVTQPKGGPLTTVISIQPDQAIELTGPFTPDKEPDVVDPDPVFGVRVETHKGKVVWTAPLRFAPETDVERAKITVKINGQICSQECRDFNETPIATFGGYLEPVAAETGFEASHGHVRWRGLAVPRSIAPGQSIRVQLIAEPQGDYHIYPYSESPRPGLAWSPTLVHFSSVHELHVAGPEVEGALTSYRVLNEDVQYHSGAVTWTFTLTLPADSTARGDRIIRGLVGFQMCTNSSCDEPTAVSFELHLGLGEASTESTHVTFSSGGTYAELVRAKSSTAGQGVRDAGVWRDYPAILVMGLAFLAGLILNIMPCVLPVIGIKIMSFVSQAGSSAARLVILNLVFSAGIIAVFLVLATLAVFFGFGWGDLYKNNAFTIVMVSVLFVFALSFIGVWEIPIPGFLGSAGGAAQQKEGFLAAFVKGTFATILATPCSGPLLVPAVVWASAQPVWVAYLVFGSMGLGMASPYLVIGAIPRLARALPKPGAWMQTFKVLMGFALLGAVVFFLGSVSDKFAMPTLVYLVFLGMACWFVGRVHVTAERRELLLGWGRAAGIVVIGAWVSFYFLIPRHELPWEPYTRARLEKYLAEGRPVFIDATANWCATCKLNEFSSLNRPATKSFFAQHRVVPLKADNTDKSPEINELLDRLGNTARGLPYYALFLPDRREDPLHFGGETFLGPEDFLKRIRGEFGSARAGQTLTSSEGGQTDKSSQEVTHGASAVANH